MRWSRPSAVVISILLLWLLPGCLVFEGRAAQSADSRAPAAARPASPPGRIPQASPPAAPARRMPAIGKLPLRFEPNLGQTDRRVKFLSRAHGYTLFLTGDEAVLSLRSQKSEVRSPKKAERSWFPQRGITGQLEATTDKGPGTTDVLQLKLVGANPNPQVNALDELPGESNYLLGRDPEKWRTHVPNFARVKYQDVYPGVDLVYYGHPSGDGQLEYDFVVAPGGDPRAIVLGIETGNWKLESGDPKSETRKSKLAIDSQGDLVIQTGSGEVRLHKPLVYQPADSGPRTVDVLHSPFTISTVPSYVEEIQLDRRIWFGNSVVVLGKSQ